jgi:hypothetical protein
LHSFSGGMEGWFSHIKSVLALQFLSAIVVLFLTLVAERAFIALISARAISARIDARAFSVLITARERSHSRFSLSEELAQTLSGAISHRRLVPGGCQDWGSNSSNCHSSVEGASSLVDNSFVLLFLGVRSWSPVLRGGPPDLL